MTIPELVVLQRQEADFAHIGRQERDPDPQGIPWHRLRFNRDEYREQRVSNYKNYTNVVDLSLYDSVSAFHATALRGQLTPLRDTRQLFTFYRNNAAVRTSIVHFQLRNLLWATSSYDIFAVHGNYIKHWNVHDPEPKVVLDLTGTHKETVASGVGMVHISTACAQGGLVVAGGFNGELVLADRDGRILWSTLVSKSDNCITNGLELTADGPQPCLLAANNDCRVRVMDLETADVVHAFHMDWAANWAIRHPSTRSCVAVGGDDCDVHLFDTSSGRPVQLLKGHLDWTFALAWHPAGNLLATGNQDCTTRVWDIRSPAHALAVLPGTMGSIRACRFSSDGALLAAAEPADFVHLYSVRSGLQDTQVLDMFGEISGISFTPDSQALFVGIPDQVYNSTLCFLRSSGDCAA